MQKNPPRKPDRTNFFHRRSVLALGAASGAALGAALMLGRTEKSAVQAPPPKDEAKDVLIEQFDGEGESLGTARLDRVVKAEADWRRELPRESFEVTRHAETERPFTGATWNEHGDGVYHCVCCDTAAFDSRTKYDSRTGWPSFWRPISPLNIVESDDYSIGIYRTAISCRRCDAHLGHLFNDGPKPTGQRYCMNSAAMRFAARAGASHVPA